MAERFEATTTVRRPRVVLMWALVAAMMAIGMTMVLMRRYFHGMAPIGPLPFWLMGPAIAAVQRRPKIETLAVRATPAGLTLGDKLVPRAKLRSAMLRREGERMFVLLRGKSAAQQIDVEVADDAAADQLCTALALDAKSTTAEFTMIRKGRSMMSFVVAMVAMGVAGAVTVATVHNRLMPFITFGVTLLAVLASVFYSIRARQTKLRVGADGLVVTEGFAKRGFVSHDDIEKVAVEGAQVVVTRKHGQVLRLDVNARAGKKQLEEVQRQAQTIAWRIDKARDAYAALAGEAPQAALALDRGQKTVREWIDQLRRVGEGASATFRDVGLTREQLLRVVESTTAAAKERLAAAVALRSGLTEEEKPRIRVAADRCAEPAMGERMVRVAFAENEEELIEALSDDDVARR